jgi:hypothetical protein
LSEDKKEGESGKNKRERERETRAGDNEGRGGAILNEGGKNDD